MISKLLILLTVILSNVSLQFGQQKTESLNYLISYAIQISPKIKMLHSKFNIAKSGIEIGTNLPDPVLTLGLVNMPTNSFSFTQEPMTGKIVGLSQKIPFPGSLNSASEVKVIDTSIVRLEVSDLKNKIANEVSELYYSVQVFREDIRLSQESIKLLNQIFNVVKRKYEVGSASLQSIIQVEVQKTRIKDKIEKLRGKENSAIVSLNALLLRNELSNISTREITPIHSYRARSDSLLKIAEANRPFLKGIKLAERKAVLMKDQAKYSYYPNFMLALQYSQRDYNAKNRIDFTDFFSVVVGVTIPINYGGNKSAKVDKAIHLQAFYKDQYNSSLQMLQQSFGKITTKLDELQNREKLITQTLLPQVQQSFKASLSDYQIGKIDFVNVIKAENDILKIKTELASVRTDYQIKITQLKFLSGSKIL